jgi:hypothetical protein
MEVAKDIIQSNSPKRTAMNGLDRIFSAPEFSGPVKKGSVYFLLDDTITQGATLASLAQHIRQNGGHVIAVAAVTGKDYSAQLAPQPDVLSKLREKFGPLEPKFQSLTGHSFEDLTQSEARYLANFKPAQDVIDKINADHALWSERAAKLNALASRSTDLLAGEPAHGALHTKPSV